MGSTACKEYSVRICVRSMKKYYFEELLEPEQVEGVIMTLNREKRIGGMQECVPVK
jgi:hypothetical protein